MPAPTSPTPSKRTTGPSWFQPLGWWRERGAGDAALRLAMGLDPGPISAITTDREGYSLWHYWAEGTHPEKWFPLLEAAENSGHNENHGHDNHSTGANPTGTSLTGTSPTGTSPTGASRDRCAHNGEHPWHRLMLRGHLRALQAWSSRYGVTDMTRVNSHGDDMLIAACWSGCGKTVAWTLAHGGDAQHAERQGLTGLMIAIHRGDAETVQRLVLAGSNPEAVDHQGRSALHHAGACGLAELFPILEDAGGDIEKTDRGGSIALDLLAKARRGDPEALEAGGVCWARKHQARLAF